MSIRTLSLSLIASALFAAPALAQTTLLNVSYDPTRELYVEYNKRKPRRRRRCYHCDGIRCW